MLGATAHSRHRWDFDRRWVSPRSATVNLRAGLKTLGNRRVRARSLQDLAEKPVACRPGALTGRVFKHALKERYPLTDRLHHFRVRDPACGSGNFLYIAYRELKRVEARIFERMETEFKREAKQADQLRLSFLSAQNFYGLDILPFAVEIAKVTMMIARKLAIDELHITENALPLINLDDNFIAADALLTPDGLPTPWPTADVIIGNPPFLGAKLLKPERGPDYVNTLRRAYPEVPGMADYCVYWIRKAHDHLPPCTAADPVAGRAGLVGTQNIRNNQSRVGGLD